MHLEDYYYFRSRLVEAIENVIVGPADGEEETVDDDPVNLYLSGILYPQSGTLAPELDDDTVDANAEEDEPDPPVALANVRYPSSMGITFAVDVSVAKTITVSLSAARYELIVDEADGRDLRDSVWQRGRENDRRWRRRPLNLAPHEIDVTRPDSRYLQTDHPDLQLFYRVRPADEHGHVAVTLVLVNVFRFDYSEADIPLRDAYAFYQAGLCVTSPLVNRAPFVERPFVADLGHDEDLESYRLLYRHAKEFAVGHGCSATWRESGDEPDRAEMIRATFIPRYELRLAQSNSEISGKATEMRFLVEAPRTEVVAELRLLQKNYAAWASRLGNEVLELEPQHRDIAQDHLQRIHDAVQRIGQGIDLLERDDVVWKAFRLANRAMWEQLARSIWLRNGRPGSGPKPGANLSWYPFQLAFILLCLEGIAVPESEGRRFTDLLWFPTGGGKTEAYLGLIAFTVFFRRLRNGAEGGGVTAIMRYTLRLLTLQQFQRASLLICTCEEIRRRTPELGTEPISVGMWVGQKATPNTLEQARESLSRLRRVHEIEEQNPIQLKACPWCGKPLDHRNYWIASRGARLVISCNQPECDFEKGLPVYVVDEDIYTYRPTLIISTVDKFAGLPWKTDIAHLFNRDYDGRPRQLPPELIIQDELHLISGPLGTLTGLYETAVDVLCTYRGIPPKVVASTATIRRAHTQSRGLFNREVRQFPPPGLDARDSYFAVEAPRNEKGTRLYLGLMAPGTSHTSLMVRVYAALLQYASTIEGSSAVKDPYWTLIGYFNSLRVLGGARVQVQDDVNEWVEYFAARSGSKPRQVEALVELTSRVPSGDISSYLKQLTEEYPDPFALDVVLATNMISVGVDVDRLGLMAVMGQPQSASEYIQATSRVGRKYPGLVCTLFNAAKSRDRSHYESFVPFHSAIYRQVDSSSVTPFSARARDRGLHAVLIALARMLFDEFRPNVGAAAVTVHAAQLKQVADLIVERVRDVSPEEADAAAVQLNEIIARWKNRVEKNDGDFFYNNPFNVEHSLLVNAAEDPLNRQDAFGTLWSLRDVDRESNLYLVYFGKR